MRFTRTLLAFAAIIPLAAFAELTNDSMIGPGLRSRPAYDGSDSRRTEFVPVIRYFGHPWFVRSTQGVLEAGARSELAPGLFAGAQLAYEPGRQTSESGFLESHNVANVKRGGSIGLQMEWDHKFGRVPVTLLARARKHLDSDLGAQVDLRASVGILQSGRFGAGLFTQAIWANSKSAQAFYGVTPAQSVATDLPAFQPGSGWVNTSFGLLWSVDLAPKWVVVGSLESRHLRGDADRSPLVQRSSANYLTAGLAYRF
ncbi:MAG: hypothetical protein JWQ07_2767 [Ramlibacter sp.]|nr:hypothetical protein [Ramlibacter sp.]